MSINFKELRIKVEQLKASLYNRKEITSDELQMLRQYAAQQPTPANIGAYALAKRLVKENNE